MKKPTDKQIEVAADWWAARLTDCKNSGLSVEERREPKNLAYQFAELLMNGSRPTVTDEQATVFRSELVANLKKADGWTARTIGVDYGPDPVLDEALRVAGIPTTTGTLPIKTVMWLSDDGSVAVRYGYGSPVTTLLEPNAESVQP